MKRYLLLLLAAILICTAAHAQKTPFNGDSAYAVLNTLVNRMGPRPMGSAAEQHALAFAAAKFQTFGCQEAYVMPMTDAGGVNTTSGVAVGILKGRTDSIIVIGGHMDSAGPDIPGANDDGSGAASVIELARVLSQRKNNSTFVFCCWGGEEEGLRGSEYFVAHFPRLKDVVLMLQIDMTDGSGELQADPDGEYQLSAPHWLVKAAFDIYYDDLTYDRLIYPTQAATLNSSTSGSTGSDHIPFIMKGIPAIDFTSDVTYPIHTPLDNWENFNPSGLARTGDLVYKLAEKFDAGVPAGKTDEYWLVAFGKTLFFFSHPVLRFIAVIAVLLAVVALVVLRRRRSPDQPRVSVVSSALKLLLFTIVVQSCIWLSENVVGLLKDYRYPWVNNFGGFTVLGILSGLLGLWLCLAYARRHRLSEEPYGYYLLAFTLLLALTLLLSYSNAELGLYPAVSLLFLALAILVRPALVKALCAVVMPVPLIRLVFMEYTGLIQRLLTQVQRDSFMVSAIYNIAYILFFTVLSLPFVFAFVAVYRASGADLLWFKAFRSKVGLIVVASGIIIMAAYLMFQPVYDRLWQPAVRVQQSFTIGEDSGSVTLGSGEYLRGLRLTYDGKDTTLSGHLTSTTLKTINPAIVPWLAVSASAGPAVQEDSVKSFTRTVTLRSLLRPLAVNVNYRSSLPFTLNSRWVTGGRLRGVKETDRVKTLSWYSFPDSVLVIPITFALRDTQKVKESIEVTYDTLSYPLKIGRDLTMFRKRTVVNAGSTFGVPETVH